METKILSFQQEGVLSLAQLMTSDSNTFEYISCAQAIKQGKLEVKEVTEAGSVNELAVVNHSQEFVFFMDGDILIGAKQNRVLNTSILLAPESKSVLPVSCVEQGRWSRRTATFDSSFICAPPSMRSIKAEAVKNNLRQSQSFRASQGDVWNRVSELHNQHHTHSNTSDFTDIYETKKSEFQKMVEKFRCAESGNGIAIFIGKQLRQIDVFNRTEIYAEYFQRLLNGAAVEAMGQKDQKRNLLESEAKYKTLDFFDNFEKMEFERHPGAGVGTESRFENKQFTGFELTFKQLPIHLTALAKEKRTNRRNSSENYY